MPTKIQIIRMIIIGIISLIISLYLCLFVFAKIKKLEDGLEYAFCIGGDKGCEIVGTLNEGCNRVSPHYKLYIECKEDYKIFGKDKNLYK
jgi:hypothetical protein